MKFDYTLTNGASIWLSRITGTVLSENKEQHSVLRQTAPTTQVSEVQTNNGSGTVVTSVPGQIYSETLTTTSVWIKDEETGAERHLDFGKLNLPIRVGHRVSAAYGASAGNKSDGLISVYNHDTKEGRTTITNSDARTWSLLPNQSSIFKRIFFAGFLLGGLSHPLFVKDSFIQSIWHYFLCFVDLRCIILTSGDFFLYGLFGLAISFCVAVAVDSIFVASKRKKYEQQVEDLARKLVRTPDVTPK